MTGTELYDKIFNKVELSSEVVELSSVDDLKGVISKYEKMISTLDAMIPKAKKVFGEYSDLMREEDKLNNQIDVKDIKVRQEVAKKLKELGLKESDVPEIKQAENLSKEFGDKRREFQNAMRGQ